MVSKDIHILISKKYGCYFIWPRDFADVIKVLEMGKLMLYYMGVANVITSVLKSRKAFHAQRYVLLQIRFYSSRKLIQGYRRRST